MQAMFEILMGLRLISVKCIHDYLHLRFESGVILNIFNKAVLAGFDNSDLSELNGLSISSIESDGASVMFAFGAKALRVGVADEDYCGPEAMECIGTEGQHIVWQ